MNEYTTDDASQQQAMLQEEQEWLDELARNEAARREFHAWLASTNAPTEDEHK